MTGISVIPYRNPLALASAFATVYYLSEGRLDIGAGVGWMKEEFDHLRVPFVERGEIMDESIKILKVIWTENNPTFAGKDYRFKDVHFSPKVVQTPHPPFWIGGESPRAIRRAAELGDGWFPIDSNETFPMLTLEQVSDAIARLRNRIMEAGRKVEDVQIGYIPQNFELNAHPPGTGLFAGDSGIILNNIKKLEEAWRIIHCHQFPARKSRQNKRVLQEICRRSNGLTLTLFLLPAVLHLCKNRIDAILTSIPDEY